MVFQREFPIEHGVCNGEVGDLADLCRIQSSDLHYRLLWTVLGGFWLEDNDSVRMTSEWLCAKKEMVNEKINHQTDWLGVNTCCVLLGRGM